MADDDALTCYEAWAPDYPGCDKYEDAGFTCFDTGFGHYCAMMDSPALSPHPCAAAAVAGTVVNTATGRCKAELSARGEFAQATLLSIMEQDKLQRAEGDVCFDIIGTLLPETSVEFLDFDITIPVYAGIQVFVHFVLGGGMSVDMWVDSS